MICKHTCRYTQLNDRKVNLKQLNLALVNKLKWFLVLLWITNNSIKNNVFLYKHLNDQTVLFVTIQFSISHLLALSLNAKVHSLNVK